jgi:predicted SnoaL-like aldol condensation-catalyzing enzyme
LAETMNPTHAEQTLTEQNKQIVMRLFALALQGDVEGALDLVADNYVEHSPVIPAGKEGLAEFLRELAGREPTPQVTLHHVIADHEHVVVHYQSTNGPDGDGSAVADVFRLRDGVIAEHWDVVQALPESTPDTPPPA